MTRTLLIVIAILMMCVSCGVKSKPDYKSKIQEDLKVYLR